MSTVDRHDHLPVEELADYAEGLVTDQTALAAIDGHLATCGQCEQVLRDLGEVGALLAAEPEPRMPAIVAIRMEAVLAAEAHERRMEERLAARLAAAGEPLGTAAGAAGVPAVTTEQTRSLSEARRRRARAVSALAAAATVTAFAIGAAIFSESITGARLYSGGNDQAPAEAPGAVVDSSGGSEYAGPSPATNGVFVSSSGQSFTAYTLSSAAQDLLGKREVWRQQARGGDSFGDSQPPLEAEGAPFPTSRTPAYVSRGGTEVPSGGLDLRFRLSSTWLSADNLARCLAGIVPDPAAVQVLAIDLGTYDSEPAALLVLSDPSDSRKAQVRVVGTACAQGRGMEFLRTEVRRG